MTRRKRVMHYADLGVEVVQSAAWVSGQVRAYGCDVATRQDARGHRVECTPFVAFVTCARCRTRLDAGRAE